AWTQAILDFSAWSSSLSFKEIAQIDSRSSRNRLKGGFVTVSFGLSIMPDVNRVYKLKMAVRRHSAIHGPLKKAQRFLTDTLARKLLDVFRVLAPSSSPRFGPPKGSFSIFQSLLLENRRPSRVVLTDQGKPELPPNSLMVASGLHQEACQPWPIF